MSKTTRFDRIQKAILTPPEECRGLLSDKDLEIKHRYEKVFVFWLNNPHLDDQQIVSFMRNTCDVGKSIAYEDLKNIKRMLGNVTMAGKEWHRHMVVEMCRKAYKMAMARKDPKAMSLAADKIGKYMKLDKDETESLPWDELVPPNFEPDPDVTILGLPQLDNIEQKRAALRDKYLKKYDPNHFQEAEIISDGNEPQ
jgi:hypothetical protein